MSQSCPSRTKRTQNQTHHHRDRKKKYPGDTANIHCAADTHTYHTLIHYQRGKNTVHYNETVDGRPPCRDPNSCSALRADYVQGQGETGSKQSQSPKIHTHIVAHITPTFSQTFMRHIMQMQRHTHQTQCGKSVVMDLRGLFVKEQDRVSKMTVCI